MVSGLRPFIRQYFNMFQDRYEEILGTYQMIVYPDGQDEFEHEDSDDRKIETRAPYSFFEKHIQTNYDAFLVTAHLLGHAHCCDFWNRCRIPRSMIPDRLYDVVEDMYLQRLFQVIAPEIREPVAHILMCFDLYKPFQNRDLRSVINTIWLDTIDSKAPLELKAIHHYLYTHDPLEQNTFDCFVRGWVGMLTNQTLNELFIKYDM